MAQASAAAAVRATPRAAVQSRRGTRQDTPTAAAPRPSAPLDCAAAWAKYDDEADAVLAYGNGNPFERNRAISAGYARVFLSDPRRRFRWLGAGAFASKQVGCGIFDAQEMQQSTYSVDPRHRMARTAERKLGEGNAAVFRDIVPPHRMFQEHGIEGIRRCGGARPGGGMSQEMIRAFEDIDRGDEASLRASAARLVDYEQNRILQPTAFDDPALAVMLRQNQMAQNTAGELPGEIGRAARDFVSRAGSRPMKVAFSASCSGPYATRAATESALSQLANFHPYRARR